MRERKLRSTAESLERLRRSLIPYTYYIYKIQRKVKSKNTMRICSLSVPRLKDEWNQTVWSVNNLRCGSAEYLVPSRAVAWDLECTSNTLLPPQDVASGSSWTARRSHSARPVMGSFGMRRRKRIFCSAPAPTFTPLMSVPRSGG